MIDLPFSERELPKIVVEETVEGYTYVKSGEWSFCVEDDLENQRWWEDVKSLISYARHMDKVNKEQGNQTTVE